MIKNYNEIKINLYDTQYATCYKLDAFNKKKIIGPFLFSLILQ